MSNPQTPTDNERALEKRYFELAHKIQTAIAFSRSLKSPDAPGATVQDRLYAPKHLRVGIDLRAIDHAALLSLLIAKGLITREEYYVSLVAAAEVEVEDWEAKYKAAGIPASFG